MDAALAGLPPLPPSIAAFASLPLASPDQPLPPLHILEGDLVIYEYIAKRARATADSIDASLAAIRFATNSSRWGAESSQEPIVPEVECSGDVPTTGDDMEDEARMIATSMLHGFSQVHATAAALKQGDDEDEDVYTAEQNDDERESLKKSSDSEALSRLRLDLSERSTADGVADMVKAAAVLMNANTPNDPKHSRSPASAASWDGGAYNPEEDYILTSFRGTDTSDRSDIESMTWSQGLGDCEWMSPMDVGVALDAVLLSVAQFKICSLTPDDRIGRYMQQEIGYVGICCKHCFGQPGYGRYFPSTLPSFVSSFPGTAVKHIGEDCRGCPPVLTALVRELEISNQKSPVRQPEHSGSKSLLQSVWNILRGTKAEDLAVLDEAKRSPAQQTPVAADGTGITWGALLGGSELVLIEDQHLVPDTLYATFAQFEKCIANEYDCSRSGRFKCPKLGFVGLCCRYCRGADFSMGSRFFPVNVLGLGLTESCTRMVKHITGVCPKCPPTLRAAFAELEEREMITTRRYGSRKIFFRRVWMRLHGDDPDAMALEPDASNNGDATDDDEDEKIGAALPIEVLIADSQLVTMAEHTMVSDAHFVAFAQLKPCRLLASDQAGWYKDREIGFPGVCCIHCGGRPSSGRYFPRSGDNFLRSSKHSVIRHITENCTSCPRDVRNSLRLLQKRDADRSSWKIVDDSVLGAGKIFHERLWIRLYKLLDVAPGEYEVLDRSNDTNDSNGQNVALCDNSDESASVKRERSLAAQEDVKNSRRKGNLDAVRQFYSATDPE